MINFLEAFISILLVLIAFLSVHTSKLMKSIVLLSALSLIVVVAFVFLSAPDVAITEAVIGSGLVTSLFVFTIIYLKKAGAKL
ncbi:MAG: hydrogenase subunit MbhD domain-containing protein [Acholeplasmataceae bacterium]